ncbi:hypothetical protein CFB3_33490 [Clostridium folliculivorans]|uniref:Uncharacterized protein n=1 Tax=Clostridium folliculivorans TaxID=2886038 RepID=A0A9W5Y228_9CLOT|nr:hypothetical protein CFOLD11_19700 [Clostridium folliculivorans]GKU31242.1 hypothetical protein CFB3_33490 [Clostridium folliculivorans]
MNNANKKIKGGHFLTSLKNCGIFNTSLKDSLIQGYPVSLRNSIYF